MALRCWHKRCSTVLRAPPPDPRGIPTRQPVRRRHLISRHQPFPTRLAWLLASASVVCVYLDNTPPAPTTVALHFCLPASAASVRAGWSFFPCQCRYPRRCPSLLHIAAAPLFGPSAKARLLACSFCPTSRRQWAHFPAPPLHIILLPASLSSSPRFSLPGAPERVLLYVRPVLQSPAAKHPHLSTTPFPVPTPTGFFLDAFLNRCYFAADSRKAPRRPRRTAEAFRQHPASSTSRSTRRQHPALFSPAATDPVDCPLDEFGVEPYMQSLSATFKSWTPRMGRFS